jgi:truncated hemoglobin YjbI
MEGKNLYDTLGGEAAVIEYIEKVYPMVKADSTIGFFLDKVEPTKHKASLVSFLSSLFGGPNEYKGKDMQNAHKGMGINDMHYQKMLDINTDCLNSMGMPEEIVNEITRVFESFRPDIVVK